MAPYYNYVCYVFSYAKTYNSIILYLCFEHISLSHVLIMFYKYEYKQRALLHNICLSHPEFLYIHICKCMHMLADIIYYVWRMFIINIWLHIMISTNYSFVNCIHVIAYVHIKMQRWICLIYLFCSMLLFTCFYISDVMISIVLNAFACVFASPIVILLFSVSRTFAYLLTPSACAWIIKHFFCCFVFCISVFFCYVPYHVFIALNLRFSFFLYSLLFLVCPIVFFFQFLSVFFFFYILFNLQFAIWLEHAYFFHVSTFIVCILPSM